MQCGFVSKWGQRGKRWKLMRPQVIFGRKNESHPPVTWELNMLHCRCHCRFDGLVWGVCNPMPKLDQYCFILRLHRFRRLILNDFLCPFLYEQARWGQFVHSPFVLPPVGPCASTSISEPTQKPTQCLCAQVTCKGSDGVSYSDNRCTTGEPPARSRICGTGICACEAGVRWAWGSHDHLAVRSLFPRYKSW